MQQIDIFKLWNKADGVAKRAISQDEVAKASGVTQHTVSKMKNGGKCAPDKLAAVAEALYQISGMSRPAKIIVVWIE